MITLFIWWPPSLIELTHIIFNIELTHLGSEASIFTYGMLTIINPTIIIFIKNYSLLSYIINLQIYMYCHPVRAIKLKFFKIFNPTVSV